MAIRSYLERKDYGFIAGGTVLTLLAALIAPRFFEDPMRIEAYSRMIVAAVVLYGVFSIHRAIQSWAGELGRYLQLIGTGLAILMLAWVPHIGWHVGGNPEWLGMPEAFWITMFHGLTIVAFAVSTYGFHLFWKKA
jgi:FtsH-binding integral membrane protein